MVDVSSVTVKVNHVVFFMTNYNAKWIWASAQCTFQTVVFEAVVLLNNYMIKKHKFLATLFTPSWNAILTDTCVIYFRTKTVKIVL